GFFCRRIAVPPRRVLRSNETETKVPYNPLLGLTCPVGYFSAMPVRREASETLSISLLSEADAQAAPAESGTHVSRHKLVLRRQLRPEVRSYRGQTTFLRHSGCRRCCKKCRLRIP